MRNFPIHIGNAVLLLSPCLSVGAIAANQLTMPHHYMLDQDEPKC